MSSASRCSFKPESSCSLALGKAHGSDFDFASAATLAACGETRGCAGRPKSLNPDCGVGLLPPLSTRFELADRLAGAEAFRDGACE